MSLKDIFNAVQRKLQSAINNTKQDKPQPQPQPVQSHRNNYQRDERPWYWFFTSSLGTVWMQSDGKEDIDNNFPWKLHVFASSIDDYKRIARPVSEVLHDLGVTFKTIDFKYYEDNLHAILDPVDSSGQTNTQYGKAFTIYFNRAEDMYRIAKYLDTFCMINDLYRIDNHSMLDFNKHNLGTERCFGESQRVFYRAERDAYGNYISADNARKINPNQPHNPYNMPDPMQEGMQRDRQDFAFIMAHTTEVDTEKRELLIEPGYEEAVISILKQHIPQLWLNKTENGKLRAESGLDWIYTKMFFDGLKDYMSYVKATERIAALKKSRQS